MTSELKSATARANGAKSRGPKSPETRAKSSHNSLKHGFTARKTVVLECENNDEFHNMLADYVATYQPGSPVENNLVDEMAAAKWRMLRMRLIEVALLDSEMSRPHLPTDPRPEPTDPGYQIAAALRRLTDDSRALSFISRYESRLHRIQERSHRTLRELQQTRKEQSAAEPVPPPPVQPEAPPPPAKVAEPSPVPDSRVEPATPSKPCLRLRLLDKKSQNEPRKHVQRRAAVGHRGIMNYIGTHSFRCLKPFKTVATRMR
jgi:hypothetical protein